MPTRYGRIPLDPAASTPLHAQLAAALGQRIERGRPAPGDRLATVRSLAGELGLAPGTVARAYRELQESGVIEGRGRAGTFVADRLSKADRAALARAAKAYVRAVRDAGIGRDEALRAVGDAWPGA